MNLKELFDKAENGTLTWEQLKSAAGDAKFVDLNEGEYVSKRKYESEVSTLNSRIDTLNETISSRDTDLAALQKTLTEAGDLDSLKQASKNLSDLQKKYDKETKQYQEQLAKQAYEFAVKEFANSKKFTSNAAKRDFVNSMISKNLTMENNLIIGATDFVEAYSKDNADAFVAEEESADRQKPTFVAPTNTEPAPKKKTLSELMQMKNDNPDITIDF